MTVIKFPLLYVPDPEKNRPLGGGKIYVGEPDLDPITNQKQLNIVQEDGTVIPVSQPFELSFGGVPQYNNQFIRLDVEGAFSMKILDKNDEQKYYIENVYEGDPLTYDGLELVLQGENYLGVKTLAEAVADTGAYAGAWVKISDRGGAYFSYKTGLTPDGYGTISTATSSLSLDIELGSGFVNILWFGCVPDGVTSNRLALIAARDRLYNQFSGGVLYVPTGEFVIGGAPFVLKYSNMVLRGDGASSILTNNLAGSPYGNCVHIGLGREWDGDLPSAAPPYSFQAANRDEVEAGNFANINVYNTHVRNICFKSTQPVDQGMGVWMLNAKGCTAEYIYGDNVSTPVNIANDGAANPTPTQISAQESCIDCHGRYIRSINGGKWYDIAFVGAAYKCSISYGFINTGNPSKLDAAVSSGGSKRCTYSNLVLEGNLSAGKNYVGVELTSPLGDIGFNVIRDNDFSKFARAVVIFNQENNFVKNNVFDLNTIAVDTYSNSNTICDNSFSGGFTYLKFNSDSRLNKINNNTGLDKSFIDLDSAVISAQSWSCNEGYNGELLKRAITPSSWHANPIHSPDVNKFGGALIVASQVDLYNTIKSSDVSSGMIELHNLTLNTFANATGDTYNLTVRGFGNNPVNDTVGNILYTGQVVNTSSGDSVVSFNLGSLDLRNQTSVTLELNLDINTSSQVRVGTIEYSMGSVGK